MQGMVRSTQLISILWMDTMISDMNVAFHPQYRCREIIEAKHLREMAKSKSSTALISLCHLRR